MPGVFTTLQSSRFLDQEAAVAALRTCAKRLKTTCDAVVAVHLFGSFAAGTATPRSDADVVVEVPDDRAARKDEIHDAASRLFLDAPVPVDLFVRSSAELSLQRGIAGAVAQEGVRLA